MLSLEGESKRWSKGQVVMTSEVGECDFWIAKWRQQIASELLLGMIIPRICIAPNQTCTQSLIFERCNDYCAPQRTFP